MQVAGAVCQQCQEKIMTHGDGTWCMKCSAAFHADCITDGAPCAKCGTPWKPPQQEFFYSSRCPVCARPNNPPAQNCSHCGTVTHWDNEMAYVTRRSQVQVWGQKQIVFGILLILAGAAIPALLFGIATVILAFIMIPAGVLRLRAGLRAYHFR